jgi:hypothetical protein
MQRGGFKKEKLECTFSYKTVVNRRLQTPSQIAMPIANGIYNIVNKASGKFVTAAGATGGPITGKEEGPQPNYNQRVRSRWLPMILMA